MARDALYLAGKARKFGKSLSGDNFYANKFAGLRADATNAFRELKPRDPQDISSLAALVEAVFSPTTKRPQRTQAVRDLAYTLKTASWESQLAPSASEVEGALFPLSILAKANRGYLVTIGKEMNCCYVAGWYNAAAVMMRRLVEVCIIEAFESKKLENKVRKDGEFAYLSVMIDRALEEPSWNLSRNNKRELPKLRDVGNFSAHGRYYLATKTDLDKVQVACRLAVEEFLHIAGLLKD